MLRAVKRETPDARIVAVNAFGSDTEGTYGTTEQILKGIVTEARTYRVCIRLLGLAKERAEKQTKYERAREVAKRFPVLAERLPLKRKPWESEHYSISIFEALAVALMYSGGASKDKVTSSGTRT